MHGELQVMHSTSPTLLQLVFFVCLQFQVVVIAPHFLSIVAHRHVKVDLHLFICDLLLEFHVLQQFDVPLYCPVALGIADCLLLVLWSYNVEYICTFFEEDVNWFWSEQVFTAPILRVVMFNFFILVEKTSHGLFNTNFCFGTSFLLANGCFDNLINELMSYASIYWT